MKKLLNHINDTMLTIGLFCLVTIGLPQVLPETVHQVIVYFTLSALTSFIVVVRGNK